MFNFWQQFKNELESQKIDFDFQSLSPQHKANVIPYLINKLDNNLIVATVCKIKQYPIYKNQSESDRYISDGFVISNRCAYFINPLDQLNIQVAYERTHFDKVPKFTSIGIIAANNPIFENASKQTLEIGNEHSSLKFYKKLIKVAMSQNASDIHIAPRSETDIYFRFRIDGVLIDNLIDDLDIGSYKFVANQILAQSGGESGNYINIFDGKINFKDANVDVSIRVSMMPTDFLYQNGTNISRFVLRIHDNLSEVKSLSALGLNTHTYEQVLNLTKLNQGLVVVTGPTGSGKTTLLYALLSDINNQQLGVSIQTLEDPVEKKLPGLDQCSINKDAGTTYERGLVAFLRQDLDAALIGEIRDETTAKKVTEVAMTGHLALTTLHTNTALGTINRLRRLGIDDRDTADTLKSVIATRLVRKVCKDCAVTTNTSNKCFDSYRNLFNVNKVKSTQIVTHGDGCTKCNFKSYKGRLLVAEIFTLDTQAQLMITQQKSALEIEQYLVSQGQQSLWHHATELLLQGDTTLQELKRVLPPYSSSTNFNNEGKGEAK
ncbi:Type IV fimbrial assembly, ATPase PilB [uncultured Gammaproteobacteria bacterium]|jgi:type II secretory ATPase GspE/PulE/Tfp pilus assembly ATPase PilB-like protein|nr:Type IV fimbrial assembly, ATPase PilB [uncultured Gammaproteobacteria bacterium]VVM18602.1 Type IV fimbrial assembly, ATPase PilB [uncultured Gammaproteobacteria bacterium]